jgi:plastocyanin domain-containing protein/copper chaperone CopZ
MTIKKEKIKVFDMTCTSCEGRVERAVTQLAGVKTAKASFSAQSLIIEYDTDFCNAEKIKNTIKETGYGTENFNNMSKYKIAGMFLIVAAIILIGGLTGLIDINAKLLSGVKPTASSGVASLSGDKPLQSVAPVTMPIVEDGVQIVRMTADGAGYTPNGLYIQKNVPVKWIIDGKSLNSCNGQIIIPSLDIERTLKPGENIIEFTPKDEDINFSCGMGMIRGIFKVVDDVNTVDTSKPDDSIPAPSAGMSCCIGEDSTAPVPPQKPSIYGTDISTVETSRLIHVALLSGGKQTAAIKGTGYEFDPLIIVVAKNVTTTLSFDLNNFDTPNGIFEFSASDTGKNVTTFEGKKGIIDVNATFSAEGMYPIIKDANVVGAVVVVDDLKNVDLEKIRKDFLGV